MSLRGVRRLGKLWRDLRTWRHRRRLRRSLLGQSPGHDQYLRLQIERTLLKRGNALPPRALDFIERVSSLNGFAGKEVLCVGCRNAEELEAIRTHGARRVVGIDLFSEHPDILVMDMHRMSFPDASFDLIYSSHSFEHALDPSKAAREFLRVLRPGGTVAIEVPVGFEARGADLQDYTSAENLLSHFEPHVGEVPLSEVVHSEPGAPPSLRVIFRTGEQQGSGAKGSGG
jgi:SAM-dependent methyltransferase